MAIYHSDLRAGSNTWVPPRRSARPSNRLSVEAPGECPRVSIMSSLLRLPFLVPTGVGPDGGALDEANTTTQIRATSDRRSQPLSRGRRIKICATLLVAQMSVNSSREQLGAAVAHQLATDDQTLDFRCTLPNALHPRIAIDALQR